MTCAAGGGGFDDAPSLCQTPVGGGDAPLPALQDVCSDFSTADDFFITSTSCLHDPLGGTALRDVLADSAVALRAGTLQPLQVRTWCVRTATPGGPEVVASPVRKRKPRKAVERPAPLPFRRADTPEPVAVCPLLALSPFFHHSDLRALRSHTPVPVAAARVVDSPQCLRPLRPRRIKPAAAQSPTPAAAPWVSPRQAVASPRKVRVRCGETGGGGSSLESKRAASAYERRRAMEAERINKMKKAEAELEKRLRDAELAKIDRPLQIARERAEQWSVLTKAGLAARLMLEVRQQCLVRRCFAKVMLPLMYRRKWLLDNTHKQKMLVESLGILPGARPAASDLRGLRLFHKWSNEGLDQLTRSMTLRCYEAGSHVAFEDEPALFMALIAAGSLALSTFPACLRKQQATKGKAYSSERHAGSKEEGDAFLWEVLCWPHYKLPYSVFCAVDVALWTLSPRVFQQILATQSDGVRWHYDSFMQLLRDGERHATLSPGRLKKSLQMFSDCEHWTPPDMEELIERMQPMVVSAGVQLIAEGDFGNDLFYVEQGSVVLYGRPGRHSHVFSKEEDREALRTTLCLSVGCHVIRVLSSGAGMGEYSFIWSEPRHCTVETLTAATVWVLAKSDFQDVVLRDPDKFHATKATLSLVRDLRLRRPDAGMALLLELHVKIDDMRTAETRFLNLMKKAVPLVLSSGESLHLRGDTVTHVYIFIAGQLEVTESAKRQTAPSGLFVGIPEAMVDGFTWRHTLRASGYCELWCIPAPVFLAFLSSVISPSRYETQRRNAHFHHDAPYAHRSLPKPVDVSKVDLPPPPAFQRRKTPYQRPPQAKEADG